MLSSLFYLCLAYSVSFCVSDDQTEGKDDYRSTTEFIPPTSPDIPFIYIERLCENIPPSECRTFRCTAFSQNKTTIIWKFKHCQDDSCQEEKLVGTSKINGSTISSNLTLNRQDAGYLICEALNSRLIEKIAPINRTDQIVIKLLWQRFRYEVLPDSPNVFMRWHIKVVGHPKPKLNMYNVIQAINNETIDCEKSIKYDCIIYDYFEDNILHLNNISISNSSTNFYAVASNFYETKKFKLNYNLSGIHNIKIIIKELNEKSALLQCYSQSLLTCDVSWYFKPCLYSSNCNYKLLQMKTNNHSYNLEYSSELRVNSSMSGYLRCVVNNSLQIAKVDQAIDSVSDGLDIFVNVSVKNKRKILNKNNLKVFQNAVLTCSSSAINYIEDVRWAWLTLENDINDSNIVSITKNTIFSNQRTFLTNLSNFVQHTGGGILYCKSWLKNRTLDYKEIELKFEENWELTYFAIAALIIVIIIITIVIVFKMRTYKKLQKEIKEFNLTNLAIFKKGALKQLNPNLTLDDQADLLPYDERFEFPTENLKLGERIGSGAFGVVVKAEATGVYDNETSTTVAVKMVNRNIGDIYIKALISELKIMIHLGKHINIVNLLGAVTKNITKRELLVIVEYCRFGNLKDYLLNHRNTFIDQINKETGLIDFEIGGELLENTDPEFLYVTPSFTNHTYQKTQSTSASSEKLNEEDETELENCNYKGHYDKITKPVCTRDLLIWSFQIACGMEYLTSRKVLHGDLAARNVLLTDGNIIKICDFGLSKNLYQQEIYKKSGDEMLPVKWMAIEAITDKIFSIQSDVWSFGIVMWELFSLARTPYPGMEYNESFCEKLLNGYRMKPPLFATQELYDIMLNCWHSEPIKRPSFSQIVGKLASILEKKITEHYIDMNTGYLKMNAQRFEDNNFDYVSMISAPTFEKFLSPHRYVNVITYTNGEEQEDTYI